jgi:hypothetical protein
MRRDMKNMIRKVFVAVLMLAGVSMARADLGWHLAYEHDASGNAMNGTSLSTLIAAIDAGADVKLMMWENGDNSYRIGIPITVSVGPNHNLVYSHHREVSFTTDANGNEIVQTNAFDLDIVVNTTGVVSISRYYKNGTKYVDTSVNWHVKWFVNN